MRLTLRAVRYGGGKTPGESPRHHSSMAVYCLQLRGMRKRFPKEENAMSSSSEPSGTSGSRFRAREINSKVQNAIWRVRHSAKIPTLHRDSAMLMACAVAADIWTRYNLLFRDSAKIADDAARDRVGAILWEAVDPVLHRICELRPTTIEGYRARAAVFLAWDAGEMLARAETGGALDKLPLAVVLDLLSDSNTG